MKTQLYLIEAITSLHVGSGEINYGLVDNLIQRDVLSMLPVINASGVKGSLLEFMKFQQDKTIDLRDIFGGTSKDNQKSSQPGKYRFFDANLLALPARSDKVPYIMVTCPLILSDLMTRMKELNYQDNNLQAVLSAMWNAIQGKLSNICDEQGIAFYPEINPIPEDSIVEDMNIKVTGSGEQVPCDKGLFKLLFGSDTVVVVSDKDFSKLCDDEHLPIIARNNLANGQSTNLWYEQILPRCSRLVFFVMHDGEELFKSFNSKITASGTPCQFGANASIGYGFCKISNLQK